MSREQVRWVRVRIRESLLKQSRDSTCARRVERGRSEKERRDKEERERGEDVAISVQIEFDFPSKVSLDCRIPAMRML